MPLYNDLGFYSPSSKISTFSYTPSSSFLQSGYPRAVSGYYKAPTPRYSNFNRIYTPLLKPINENPFKRKYVKPYPGTYVSPRPIQINTADIDVSANKFDKNRHHRVRSTSPEVKQPEEPPKENEYTGSKDFMPRIDQNDAPQFRSTIKRCRPIVRLSTWRKRSISRSKSNSVEKRDSEKSNSSSKNGSVKERKSGKKKLSTSNSSSSVDSGDGRSSNTIATTGTSWRDKLEDVLKETAPKVVRKTPGELILERHIIRDNKKDVIEKVPQIPKTIVEIPQTVTEQEITYLEPMITRSIRKQSLKHCPSFKDICKDISSDIKVNDDLNACVLRRRASLIHEQEQQILAQFITQRRLSADIVNVDASIMEVDEESDKKEATQQQVEEEKPRKEETTTENKITIKKKTKAKGGKLKHKITVTVEVNNLDDSGKSDVTGASVKKSPKWEAVVEKVEQNDTLHKMIKLPKKRLDDATKKQGEKVLRSESGVDFWKLIGRKSSIFEKAPKSKLPNAEEHANETKQNDTKSEMEKTNKTTSNEIQTVKQECAAEITDTKTASIAKKTNENKIEMSSSGSSESGLKEAKKINKKKTTGMTQSETKENKLTNTNENRKLTEEKVCTEKDDKSKQDTLYTKSLMQTNQLKIATRPTAKAPETKQKQIHGSDERGIEKSGNDVFDINETVRTADAKNSKTLDDVNAKLKQEIIEKTDDKTECKQKKTVSPIAESAAKIDLSRDKLPSTIEIERCDKVGNIASDEKNEHLAKSNTLSPKASEQNDIFETDGLTKYPTINDLSSNLSTRDNVNREIISDVAVVDDSENCISGEESIDFLSSADSDSGREGDSSDGSGAGGSGSGNEMGLKKRHRKKKKDQFDPKKVVKLDHSRKCYVVNEEPKYPLIATPKPLQKKYHFYSDSETENDDSYSDEDSSDEYYDDDVIKDVIRMSRCSNDSGFEGSGAVLTNPKKILETSYTFTQYQQSGKITTPATTIPRFKKYSLDDFYFLNVLGKGSFGKVFLAELKNTDYYYAIKCLKKDIVQEDNDVECTLIERKVLALGTKHPFLCHLFCTFQTESHLFFVMEYLNGGDLMFHIQVSGRFPEPRAKFYAAEIICGLKFLHKKGIIYRDLKLDNILLDYDGHARIADFGMCKLQIYLDRTADSFCGTPDYMSPEVVKGQKYTQTVDWWSFGVLLYEMLIAQSPFSGCDEDELFWSICNERPWFPFYLSKDALNILSKLLEKDQNTRLGSPSSPHGEITDNDFFYEIDWKKLERRQLEPPFKPKIKHPLDTQYFDRAFTRERVRLTPISVDRLQSIEQPQFQGFTYTNPNVTPS